VDRRALEKSVANVTRLLEDQKFGSIDEANAFLEGMLSSGELIEFSPWTPLEKAQDLMEAVGDERVNSVAMAVI
jgi:hypothetical protein